MDSALPPPPPPPPTDEERYTPPPEEREVLLDIVGRIVQARGHDRLLRAPLLAPIPDHFPDRWEGDPTSVRRVVRRLCHYAGIDVQKVRAHPWRADAAGHLPAGGPTEAHQGCVWFQKADPDGTVHFGIDVQQASDAVAVGSASARAVAHAWLSAHGPAVPMAKARLPLAIDVAGVFLGFGVLTTQAAIAHRVGASAGMSSQRKTTRLGVAGPIRMAYLLALFALARDMGPRAQKQVAGLLNPNPATFFRASIDSLEPTMSTVATRLRLPTERPAQFPLSMFTGPLPEPPAEDGDATVQPAEDEVRGLNVGKPVFRIEKSMATSLGRFFGLGTMVLGGFASRAVADSGVSMGHVTVTGLGLAVLGLVIGRFIPDHRCSESKCGQRLPRDATTCPRCGGTIAGSIRKATDRLAAEEHLSPPDTTPSKSSPPHA